MIAAAQLMLGLRPIERDNAGNRYIVVPAKTAENAIVKDIGADLWLYAWKIHISSMLEIGTE
jgi:hypothetical protein